MKFFRHWPPASRTYSLTSSKRSSHMRMKQKVQPRLHWLGLVVMTLPLSGCSEENPDNDFVDGKFHGFDLAAATWLPGREWTFVDDGEPSRFIVRILNSNLSNPGGRMHLMSWNQGDGVDFDTARLVAADHRTGGRVSRWADPVHVGCLDDLQLHPNSCENWRTEGLFSDRLEFTDAQQEPPAFAQFRLSVRPEQWDRVGDGTSSGWFYRGMTADVRTIIWARGPHLYTSPYLGEVDVIDFRLEREVMWESKEFSSFADQMAADGVDVRHFNLTGEWGIAQGNFVHIAAHGGDGPGQAFSTAFFTDGSPDTNAREYWLQSTGYEPVDDMPPLQIHANWGGALPPSEVNPYALYMPGTARHFVAEGGQVTAALSIEVVQTPHYRVPDDAILHVEIRDGNQQSFYAHDFAGTQFVRKDSGNGLQFTVEFTRPGAYAMQGEYRGPDGNLLVSDEWVITVDVEDTVAFACPTMVVATSVSPCELELASGPADLLNISIRTTSSAPLEGHLDVLDASGAIVWATDLSETASTTITPKDYDSMGPWTARWTPPAIAADAKPEIDVKWTTTPEPNAV